MLGNIRRRIIPKMALILIPARPHRNARLVCTSACPLRTDESLGAAPRNPSLCHLLDVSGQVSGDWVFSRDRFECPGPVIGLAQQFGEQYGMACGPSPIIRWCGHSIAICAGFDIQRDADFQSSFKRENVSARFSGIAVFIIKAPITLS